MSRRSANDPSSRQFAVGESQSRESSITYEAIIPVRYDDLDPYGHVNSGRYLDFVVSSRWIYLEKVLGMTAQDFVDDGIGFFLARSQIEYKKPIKGAQQILVRSRADELRGSRLVITFEIFDEKGELLYTRGTLKYAVVDLNSGRLLKPTKRVRDVLFRQPSGPVPEGKLGE